MKATIEQLAKEFNKRNLTWAIGGSFLLQRYGINDGLNELDIMVSEDSVKELNKVMNEIAVKLEVVNNESYQTGEYSVYQMDHQTINIICNLKCNFEESFTYNFDKEDISSYEISNNEKIYFSNLLDWYVIYHEIKRSETLTLIENYFKDGGFLDNNRFGIKFKDDVTRYAYLNNLKHAIYHS